ncbi:MAG: hypothetical protein HYS27_14035 [Deltaproteobacteria bacterium]|nr:hypothetical protein [Deltaproteobacteria bacterium]
MRSTRRRDLAALLGALALHGALLVVITESRVRRYFPELPTRTVELTLIEPAPPEVAPAEPAPVDDRPTPPPRPREAPTPTPAPAEAPPTVEPPAAAPPPGPPPAPAPALPANSGSLVRLPAKDTGIARVFGTGDGPLPSVATLEGSLDLKPEGPLSERARAKRNVQRHLAEDLADDIVVAGLADDYFRALKDHVEVAWRPAMKELNDGGESVTQIGMMKSVVEDRVAWDEAWRAYLDLAKQYAVGQKPTLEPARRERIRELMRSRKGMFRFHAITEVELTQGPDGRILTLELPLPSGHPGIDEGVRDAFVEAVKAMTEPPPKRVARGEPFLSTWRMRATWTMVPPTAFLTGAGFDITPKGFEIDVPFDINLKTHVLLMRTSATPGVSSGEAAD